VPKGEKSAGYARMYFRELNLYDLDIKINDMSVELINTCQCGKLNCIANINLENV
jgi:hypothetical protein